MSAYRQAPPQLSQARRTPWWRILRAWLSGSLARIPGAQACRDTESRRRSAGLTSLSGALRLTGQIGRPAPKGPQPLPVNIPE